MTYYNPLVANRRTTVGRLRYLAETIPVPEAKKMLHSAANSTEELIKSVELLINLIEGRNYFSEEPSDFTAVSDIKSALANIKHFVKEDTQ
jgi:hypothetical protein